MNGTKEKKIKVDDFCNKKSIQYNPTPVRLILAIQFFPSSMRGDLVDPELSAKKTRAPGLRWIDGLEGKAVEDLLDHCPPSSLPTNVRFLPHHHPPNLLKVIMI